MINQLFQVNFRRLKGTNAPKGISMCLKPKFHLLQHVLVYLAQRALILLTLRLLLIQNTIVELCEVIWLDFFHDEIKRARCHELCSCRREARQLLECRDPVN